MGSWGVGEHDELVRWMTKLTEENRSSFEKTLSKNPTNFGEEASGVARCWAMRDGAHARRGEWMRHRLLIWTEKHHQQQRIEKNEERVKEIREGRGREEERKMVLHQSLL